MGLAGARRIASTHQIDITSLGASTHVEPTVLSLDPAHRPTPGDRGTATTHLGTLVDWV
jgi:hypothetical protein